MHTRHVPDRPGVPPYGITLLILVKRHTIPQKIRQMPGPARKGDSGEAQNVKEAVGREGNRGGPCSPPMLLY